jgi:pimeloyl-ACP methyl ester carboxylesterase
MSDDARGRLMGMATFLYLHGAGDHGASWELVAARIRAEGHAVVAPDLPCDEEVPLDAYVDAAVDAVDAVAALGAAGDVADDLVVVAQSLAGFVAPIVATRVPVRVLVLVAAMVPRPGETAGEWWEASGQQAAYRAQGLADESPEALFLHDVPADVVASSPAPREQAGRIFEDPFPLPAWPDVTTRFVLCRDDRLFPATWLRGMVRERLGIEPIEIPGGHCAYLSQPDAMADAVLRCWAER